MRATVPVFRPLLAFALLLGVLAFSTCRLG